MSSVSVSETEMEEIMTEAVKRFRQFERRYMCQDMNVKLDSSYWIMQVCKERWYKK